jgi:hypothetical protein
VEKFVDFFRKPNGKEAHFSLVRRRPILLTDVSLLLSIVISGVEILCSGSPTDIALAVRNGEFPQSAVKIS